MGRTVVVGAGLAGLRAAQKVRELSPSETIILVGDEKHRPYNRPPLSKQILAGSMSAQECEFETRSGDFEWILGNAATGLDVERNIVRLSDGEVSFDKLIIATGRGARVLSDTPDLAGMHVLRGIDDAVALSAEAVEAARVVIVGGGFIGCEVASTLKTRGVESVTIIERAPTLLPLLGPVIGEFAATIHREHGVDVRCGTVVSSYRGGSRIEFVELEDGTLLEADLVLLALGSVPNTGWLEGSGLELDAGSVVCDQYCHALGHPNIVAVGDVASWYHNGVGRRVRIEHWSNAAEMGGAAAENLFSEFGAKEAYSPIPTFWTDQYDLNIKAAGFVAAATSYEPVDTGNPAKWNWDGFDESGLVAGVTANDNKAFLKYRRSVAAALAPAKAR